jgi:hypothetical protein
MPLTDLAAGTAEHLWSRYVQLTETEASFRALKSELSIRPLFHKKEPRVKAHAQASAEATAGDRSRAVPERNP